MAKAGAEAVLAKAVISYRVISVIFYQQNLNCVLCFTVTFADTKSLNQDICQEYFTHRPAAVSSVYPPIMATHEERRKRVCAVCLCRLSSKSKDSRHMNAAYQDVLKIVFEDYDMDSKRYPNGLCNKCRCNLDCLRTGKLNYIPNFTPYGPTAINVDELSVECTCHICQITKQNGLLRGAVVLDGAGDSAPSEVFLCSKCYSPRIKGGNKDCSKTTLFHNLMALDPDIIDNICAENLRRKNSSEVELPYFNGGKPLHVYLEKPKAEMPILTHEVFIIYYCNL